MCVGQGLGWYRIGLRGDGRSKAAPGGAQARGYAQHVCRSIKTLRGVELEPSDDEIRAAALQFVRKVSGYRAPSQRNRPAFDDAVDDVTASVARLLDRLETR